jgi:hypothetical protein
VWFPILAISANGRVITTDASLLADNAVDTDFSIIIARNVYTAATYTDRYFTLEEYGADIDRSKLGSDMKFNSLSVSVQPDAPARVSIGLGGRDMEGLASGSSPHFTTPTTVTGTPLILRDGGVYVNGTKKLNLTGITAGLSAPVSTVPVIASALSPDVFLGQFSFAGEVTGVVEDFGDLDLFTGETQVSLLLHFAAQTGAPKAFTSMYFGNLSLGGYSSPAGGEGAQIASMQLWGGSDDRGGAYAATTALICTSAT